MKTGIVVAAATIAALGGCANPRAEARDALHDLRAALDQHARVYGAYPSTIDPARPLSATNLPHHPPAGVGVELVHAGADGFQALARRRPWVCSMNVDATRRERLKCAPLTSNGPERPDSGAAPRPALPLETRP
jgi:hypothetical protein